MNKIVFFLGLFYSLTLGFSGCKKKVTPPSVALAVNGTSVSDPDPNLRVFSCGKGGFDGKRFYVLKSVGDTDYNAYKHTPKTKGELIKLLDNNVALGTINTYYITNMDSLFYGREGYNFSGIDRWMTCNVTTMNHMFAIKFGSEFSKFNEDISGWNVSKVTNMRAMFSGCRAFNQPLNSWDVGNVTTMSWMFSYCVAFNQPLNSWDVGKVTTMSAMFSGCRAFNQSLSNWDVSKVTTMSAMFSGCGAFNQSLSNWM